MNLTAVREVDEVMERHIVDSLAIIPPIQNSYISHCDVSHDNISVVDVGSGAGLPGLVLAIARPGRLHSFLSCFLFRVRFATFFKKMGKRCDACDFLIKV